MKDFLKFMFASMLGFLIMSIILFFVFMGMITSFANMMQKQQTEVADNSLLKIELNTPILDRAPKGPFTNFDFTSMQPKKSLGLNDILNNLDKAARDPKIKGIYMDVTILQAGTATIEEIRDALLKFKESGKFIIAYADAYSQGAYYLASVADNVYLNPEGMIDFKGLSAQLTFFKGTLDKLDVDMQIIRHGKYKSAVEPFMRKDMSDANREQMMALVNGIWNRLLKDISDSRNIPVEELNTIADGLLLQKPEDAVKMRLVDGLKYKDEILAELRRKLGIGDNDRIEAVSMPNYTYAADPSKERPDRKNRVAVIYALGEIITGEGSDEIIGSDRISAAIRDARLDDHVKAIVMRVNSPGGSALASDVILREVKLAAQEKPFVVSMGDVAASGGYYISCGADKIFADPSTITGSIGVLGMIPNLEETMKDLLGVTFDYAETNANSNFMTTFRPLTEYQHNVIKGYIENTYDTFVTHVSEGRDMSWEQVNDIGQGRVWVGSDALNIHLIDQFGGLTDAVDAAVEMAGLETYTIKELPVQKDPVQELVNELLGNASIQTQIQKELGAENYRLFQYLKYWQDAKGVQARLPFNIFIN